MDDPKFVGLYDIPYCITISQKQCFWTNVHNSGAALSSKGFAAQSNSVGLQIPTPYTCTYLLEGKTLSLTGTAI